jgi:hypothetical protein
VVPLRKHIRAPPVPRLDRRCRRNDNQPESTTSNPAVPAFAWAGLGAADVLYAFFAATWISARETTEPLGDLVFSYKLSDIDRFRESPSDEMGTYIDGGGWALLAASVLFIGLAVYSGSRLMRVAGIAAAVVGAAFSLDVGVGSPAMHTVTTDAGTTFTLSEGVGPWFALGGFCALAISTWLCPRQAKRRPAGWYPSETPGTLARQQQRSEEYPQLPQ